MSTMCTDNGNWVKRFSTNPYKKSSEDFAVLRLTELKLSFNIISTSNYNHNESKQLKVYTPGEKENFMSFVD